MHSNPQRHPSAQSRKTREFVRLRGTVSGHDAARRHSCIIRAVFFPTHGIDLFRSSWRGSRIPSSSSDGTGTGSPCLGVRRRRNDPCELLPVPTVVIPAPVETLGDRRRGTTGPGGTWGDAAGGWKASDVRRGGRVHGSLRLRRTCTTVPVKVGTGHRGMLPMLLRRTAWSWTPTATPEPLLPQGHLSGQRARAGRRDMARWVSRDRRGHGTMLPSIRTTRGARPPWPFEECGVGFRIAICGRVIWLWANLARGGGLRFLRMRRTRGPNERGVP